MARRAKLLCSRVLWDTAEEEVRPGRSIVAVARASELLLSKAGDISGCVPQRKGVAEENSTLAGESHVQEGEAAAAIEGRQHDADFRNAT